MEQTVFSCSIARHEGVVDIEVIGRIDRSSAGQFRNQLLTLAKEHPGSIAIHMDRLALIDSSCVAVLVEAWRFMQEHGIAADGEVAGGVDPPGVRRRRARPAPHPAPLTPDPELPGLSGTTIARDRPTGEGSVR